MVTRRCTCALFVAILLVCAAVAAPALAQNEKPGPPPPRDFGPDNTSTHVFTGEGVTEPGIHCDSPADPSTPLRCEGYLASSLDGTRLDVLLRVPRTSGSHPLVVGIHGWGGSKAAMGKYDDQVTREGYTFLRYSTRGFGKSWGQVNLADVNVEAEDLRSMIAQVADDPRFEVNPDRVGVFGASYGGAHSWLAALEPTFESPAGKAVRIAVITPIVPWTDLLNSLVPNGRPEEAHVAAGGPKASYLEALFTGGLREDPERPYPNYPEYLIRWNAILAADESNYDLPQKREIMDGLQGYRSIYWQEAFWDRVKANAASGTPQLPVLEVHGWTDDLFPMTEPLRMYHALRSVDSDYPIGAYFGDLGHPRAANKSGEVDYAIDEIFKWFAYYLRCMDPATCTEAKPSFDVQAAITRPRNQPFTPADVIRVATYDDLATRIASVSFDEAKIITFNPGNTSGFEWDPILMAGTENLEPYPNPPASDEIPGNVAVYTVPAGRLARAPELLIAGMPAVTLTAATLAYRVQLNVRIFDVKPDQKKQLVTRGTYTIDTGSPAIPIGSATITIPTYGNLWLAPARDKIRIEITNVDFPYISPSKVPSVTTLSEVRLDVPVRE